MLDRLTFTTDRATTRCGSTKRKCAKSRCVARWTRFLIQELISREKVRVKMKVTILERNHEGHRLTYVRYLADFMVANGHDAQIFLGQAAAGSPELTEHLLNSAGRAPKFTNDFSLKAIEAMSRRTDSDRVVIPDGDCYLLKLLFRGGWRGAGRLRLLVMRGKAPLSRTPAAMLRFLAKRILILAISALPRTDVFVLSSALDQKTSRKMLLHYVRDPIPAAEPKGKDPILSPRPDLYWYGVIGRITDRKNVPLILEALLAGHMNGVGLVVAGIVDPDILRRLQDAEESMRRSSIELVVENRHLNGDEFGQLLHEVDCLVLAYGVDAPSGVLGHCAAYGTRALVSGSRSLRHEARRNPQLFTWVPLRKASLECGLRLVREMGPALPIEVASPAEFAARLTGIDEAIGVQSLGRGGPAGDAIR